MRRTEYHGHQQGINEITQVFQNYCDLQKSPGTKKSTPQNKIYVTGLAL